jgi:hypothetical protein
MTSDREAFNADWRELAQRTYANYTNYGILLFFFTHLLEPGDKLV